MVAIQTLAETRTLLENISWQTFQIMLTEIGCHRHHKLAYLQGNLEIMTPQMPHENSNRILEVFIGILCEELGLEIKRTGSLTLTRDDLEYGAEPDSSYYIQNEYLMRNKENINLAFDPPPDLVIEVEYSRPKVDKLQLYAALGIPEFWRYNGSQLRLYILIKDQYVEVEISPTFPDILVKEIPNFIVQSRTVGEISASRNFRTSVKR